MIMEAELKKSTLVIASLTSGDQRGLLSNGISPLQDSMKMFNKD